MYSTKLFFLLQAPQKSQLGFSVSLYLLGQEFAQAAHACKLFLGPFSFFVFCWRGVSSAASTQHCSRGSQPPGLSQYEFPHNLYLSLSFIPRVVAVALYIPALGFSEVSQKYVY